MGLRRGQILSCRTESERSVTYGGGSAPIVKTLQVSVGRRLAQGKTRAGSETTVPDPCHAKAWVTLQLDVVKGWLPALLSESGQGLLGFTLAMAERQVLQGGSVVAEWSAGEMPCVQLELEGEQNVLLTASPSVGREEPVGTGAAGEAPGGEEDELTSRGSMLEALTKAVQRLEEQLLYLRKDGVAAPHQREAPWHHCPRSPLDSWDGCFLNDLDEESETEEIFTEGSSLPKRSPFDEPKGKENDRPSHKTTALDSRHGDTVLAQVGDNVLAQGQGWDHSETAAPEPDRDRVVLAEVDGKVLAQVGDRVLAQVGDKGAGSKTTVLDPCPGGKETRPVSKTTDLDPCHRVEESSKVSKILRLTKQDVYVFHKAQHASAGRIFGMVQASVPLESRQEPEVKAALVRVRKWADEVVEECASCQAFQRRRWKPVLRVPDLTLQLNDCVWFDVYFLRYGSSVAHDRAALLVVDEGTGEMSTTLLTSHLARSVWAGLHVCWRSRWGEIRDRLVSDPGSDVSGEEMNAFASQAKVEARVTGGRDSEGHGLPERCIQIVRWSLDRLSVELDLAKMTDESMAVALATIENGVRNTILAGGYSASQRGTGRNTSMFKTLLCDECTTGAADVGTLWEVQEKSQSAFHFIKASTALRALYHSRARGMGEDDGLVVGDRVYQYTDRRSDSKTTSKRFPTWKGPAEVTGISQHDISAPGVKQYQVRQGRVSVSRSLKHIRRAKPRGRVWPVTPTWLEACDRAIRGQELDLPAVLLALAAEHEALEREEEKNKVVPTPAGPSEKEMLEDAARQETALGGGDKAAEKKAEIGEGVSVTDQSKLSGSGDVAVALKEEQECSRCGRQKADVERTTRCNFPGKPGLCGKGGCRRWLCERCEKSGWCAGHVPGWDLRADWRTGATQIDDDEDENLSVASDDWLGLPDPARNAKQAMKHKALVVEQDGVAVVVGERGVQSRDPFANVFDTLQCYLARQRAYDPTVDAIDVNVEHYESFGFLAQTWGPGKAYREREAQFECLISGSLDVYSYEWEDVPIDERIKAVARAFEDYDSHQAWERGTEKTWGELQSLGFRPMTTAQVKKPKIYSVEEKIDGKTEEVWKLMGRVRFVPRGFQQRIWCKVEKKWITVERKDVESPTAHRATHMLFMANGQARRMVYFLLDICEAFFRSKWLESDELATSEKGTLWMEVPPEDWKFTLTKENCAAHAAYTRGERVYRKLLKEVPGTKGAPLAWFRQLLDSLCGDQGKVLGEALDLATRCTQSKVDPCAFYMPGYDGMPRIGEDTCPWGGFVGAHVDDMMGAAHEPSLEGMCQRLEKLGLKFSLKKMKEGDTIETVGRRVKMLKDHMEVDQEQYLTQKLDTAKFDSEKRWRQGDQPASETEIKSFRTAHGQGSWVAQQTKPEFQYEFSYAASAVKELKIRDIVRLNKCIRTMKHEKDKRIIIPRLDPSYGFKIQCIADAGQGEGTGDNWTRAQGGKYIGLMENTPTGTAGDIDLILCRSSRLSRVTHASFDAECVNNIELLDEALAVGMLQQEVEFGIAMGRKEKMEFVRDNGYVPESRGIPIDLSTDARDYTDKVRSKKMDVGMNKRRKLDIADTKELIVNENLRVPLHVHGKTIECDVLTKKGVDREVMQKLLHGGRYLPDTTAHN